MNRHADASVVPAALLEQWAAESREMLGLTDDAGRIDWCNPSWAGIFGEGPGGDLLGLTPLGWSDGSSRAALAAGLREGRLPVERLALRTAGGATLDVVVRLACLDRLRAWTFVDDGPERSRDAAASQLRLVAELAELALWRHDFSTGRIHYDVHGLRVLEVDPTPDGLTIEEARAHTHPDDIPTLVRTSAHALATGQPIDAQVRHRRRDGGWRDLLVRRVIERSADGTPLGFVGVALDVSEQVQQSRRAESLALRLEAAARAARIGVWTAAADGEPVEWNAEMHALFDTVDADVVPSLATWLERAVHVDDRARIATGIRRYLRHSSGTREAEFRTRRRDGSLRWIVLRADVDARAETTRFVGIAIDVTERHRALTALSTAGTRAALIARQAGIGTWEVGFEGGEPVWDEQMWRLRGLAPRPHPPDRAARLAMVHPDDRDEVIDADPEALRRPEASADEFRVRHPDGRWRWLASRSTPLVDAHGRVIGRVGVNWDVTEAKNAEATRQKALLVERESRAKSAFLARMSHELRTPMNAVLGFTQLLESEARRNRSSSRAATLGHIRAAGEHLLTLIDDALDWSRLGTGALRLETRPVAAATAVDQALLMVEGLAGQAGIAIERGPLDGTVLADPTRLRQVLLNLLTNAIKYNRPGGRVTVDAVADEARAELGLQVADTGRGIRPEQLPQLFEPFNRLGVEGEAIQGSGIGLTIVQSLVEGMGGRVEVSSAVGEGSVFTVVLPSAHGGEDAAGEATPPVAPRELPAAVARPGGRLLYIEDNAVNVLLVEELVKLRPHLRLVVARDGASGVAAALELPPSLVLVDMQLPDFDGFEVLRRLRDDPRTAALRCIALSANVMPDDVRRALAAGFDDYWTKPVRFGAFLEALDRFFPAGPSG